MKTDRFMQGILVDDEEELFTYSYQKHDHSLGLLARRIKILKKNLVNFKYVTRHNLPVTYNKQAVFSKSNTDGNIEKSITDVWFRLHIKPTDPNDL